MSLESGLDQQDQTIAADDSAPSPSQAEIAAKVATYIAEAQQLQEKGEFAKSLDRIAEAFVLDPQNEVIHKIDREIQRQYLVSRQSKPEQSAETGSDIMPEENGSTTAPVPSVAEDSDSTVPPGDNRTGEEPPVPIHTSPPVQLAALVNEFEHLRRARVSIEAREYDEGLKEVTFGLLINPISEALMALERELWHERASRTDIQPERPKPEPSVPLADHLLAAKSLLKVRNFDRALDEVTRAFRIDPLNKRAGKLEKSIRRHQKRFFDRYGTPLHIKEPGEKSPHAREAGHREKRGLMLPALRSKQERIAPLLARQTRDVLLRASTGRYSEALTFINEARECHPHNACIVATDRVLRNLIEVSRQTELDLEQKTKMFDLLQMLADRAIEYEERTSNLYAVSRFVKGTKRETAGLRSKDAVILKRIVSRFLNYGRDYEMIGEVTCALSEIRRVFLLEPDNTTAKEMEMRLMRIQNMALETLKAAENATSTSRAATSDHPADSPGGVSVSTQVSKPWDPARLQAGQPDAGYLPFPGQGRMRLVMIAAICLLVGICLILAILFRDRSPVETITPENTPDTLLSPQ